MGVWLPCGGCKSLPGPLMLLHRRDAVGGVFRSATVARCMGLAGVLRKLAAVLLVLVAVTVGIIGLMFATEGQLWGIALIALTPLGIWLATRVTPEGGTTGYFDKNI